MVHQFSRPKNILGAGEAPARNQAAVESVPGLIIATYAGLLPAARKIGDSNGVPDDYLPPPEWHL